MRSFALGLVVVAAFPALAGVPEKGDGTITLLGGARQIPTGDYGSGRQHSFFQPGLVLGFGYQADDELHGGVQIGYMLDKYGTPAGTLDIRSIQILLQLDTALVKESWYTLYAGGGLGYSLNTSTRGGANVEANSTAGFIALGGRFLRRHTFASLRVGRNRRERVWGIDPAIRDRRGDLEVIRAGWEEPGTAEAALDVELGEDVLARVLDGQARPEAEAPDRAQLVGVVEDAPPDPRNPVKPVAGTEQ